MRISSLRDKGRIEAHLRDDPYLHLYEIGDLDAPYWAHTDYLALEEEGRITALTLLYTGTSLPVLLAFAREAPTPMRRLLRSIRRQLPRRFYAHLSGGLIDLFADDYSIKPHGDHLRMAFTDPDRTDAVDTSQAIRLGRSDAEEIRRFYDASYPEHWFEPAMLASGPYFGIRERGELVSVAGVHVYAPEVRVAALGNIATDRRFRGRGLATAVTGRLCQELRGKISHVGLNVKADNRGAILCYERLGFERHAHYGEFCLEAR